MSDKEMIEGAVVEVTNVQQVLTMVEALKIATNVLGALSTCDDIKKSKKLAGNACGVIASLLEIGASESEGLRVSDEDAVE